MEQKYNAKESSVPDDALSDAAALLTAAFPKHAYILILHDLATSETRQLSNGPVAAQYELLKTACEATGQLVAEKAH